MHIDKTRLESGIAGTTRHAMMSAPSPPELLRLVLAADGVVKANFADNSILVLSASGHAFVSMQPDGHQQRQFSEFALHRHVAALAVVLEFRNMHADQPCICERVARASPRQASMPGHECMCSCIISATQPCIMFVRAHRKLATE